MSTKPTQSESINEIAAAMIKVQTEVLTAMKDGTNPHFGSEFTTLASVWSAVREPLTKNNIAVIQAPQRDELGPYLETTLVHKSGQWFKSYEPLAPVKNDPQALGSAITYARRYALCAMVGVTGKNEDDDGEAAMSAHRESAVKTEPKPVAKVAAKNGNGNHAAPSGKLNDVQTESAKKLAASIDGATDYDVLTKKVGADIAAADPSVREAVRDRYMSKRDNLWKAKQSAAKAAKDAPASEAAV